MYVTCTRFDCPDKPWASLLHHLWKKCGTAEKVSLLYCEMVLMLQQTSFAWSTAPKLQSCCLPPSELDICETIAITKQCKTQPTSASTYKVKIHLGFFPVIHCFLQPSNIFVSVKFLLHSMPCYFFSIFLFRYFASFSCSTTLLFCLVLPHYSASLFSSPLKDSDAVLQCCLTPPVHPKTVLFVCQNLTYRDLPFRKYSSKTRHLVFPQNTLE